VLNSSLVYNPQGQRVARYDKIHLFGFRQGTEHYDERATIEAGRQPVPSARLLAGSACRSATTSDFRSFIVRWVSQNCW
jgi:predicted amidohydrolase